MKTNVPICKEKKYSYTQNILLIISSNFKSDIRFFFNLRIDDNYTLTAINK